MTTPASIRRRVDAFDGLRAIACLLVFFLHSGVNLLYPPLVIWGFTGVHLFFVLSGYLLFSPFLASLVNETPLPSWSRFYLRRFLRIYPPYAVALVAFTLLRYATKQKPPDVWNFLTHALLIFNYFDVRNFFSINGVFWSLAIEAQFYVVLPLSVWLATRLCGGRGAPTARALILGYLVVGVLSRTVEFYASQGRSVSPEDDVRFRTIFSYLDLFGFGMAAAYGEWRWGNRLREARPRRLLTAGVGLAIFLAANNWSYFTKSPDWLTNGNLGFILFFPFLLCAGLSLVLLSVCTTPADRPGFLNWPSLVAIGTISYSVYLYHIGVETAFLRWFPLRGVEPVWLRLIARALIALPPTLILSAVMFYLVEKPFLGMMSRFKSKPAKAAVESPDAVAVPS